MQHSLIIQEWFKAEGGGTLLLPDGWFGRPYDNLHTLTSIDEARDILTIILDGDIILRFEELKNVALKERDLTFSEFDRLSFKWKGAETLDGSKIYQGGEVKIVSHALSG